MSTLLTPEQVAERLTVSVEWVRSHANGKRRPVLPSLKVGKFRRFRPEDVEKFLDQYAEGRESVA